MKNLFDRFFVLATPPFWKRLQLVCAIISIALAYFSKTHILPDVLMEQLSGFFAAGVVLAQFAREDIPLIQEAIAHPGTLVTVAPHIIDQIEAIHNAIIKPQPISLEDIQKISDEQVNEEKPAAIIGAQMNWPSI